jgi:hypothetical protein
MSETATHSTVLPIPAKTSQECDLIDASLGVGIVEQPESVLTDFRQEFAFVFINP